MKSRGADLELQDINVLPAPATQNPIKTADALLVAAFVGRFTANAKAKQNKTRDISETAIDNKPDDNKTLEVENEQQASKSDVDNKKKKEGTSSNTNFGTKNIKAGALNAANKLEKLDQSYQSAFIKKYRNDKSMKCRLSICF